MRHQRILTFCLLVLVCCHGLRAQSLWNHRRPTRTLFADRTARDIGDILTIIIDEQQRVENDEETRLEKGSTLAGVLSNFDIFPKMFQTMPAIDGSIQRDFNSKGKYDKDNRFQTRVSVLVVDVLPNGNLVLEGTRRLLVERKDEVDEQLLNVIDTLAQEMETNDKEAAKRLRAIRSQAVLLS